MATFTVKIDCDNSAFDFENEGEPYELARILREIANKIERQNPDSLSAFATIHDANGNDVGRYALKGRKGATFR